MISNLQKLSNEELIMRVRELEEENKMLKVEKQSFQKMRDRLLENFKSFRTERISALTWMSKCLSIQLGYTTLTHADRKGQVLMLVKLIENDIDEIERYHQPCSPDINPFDVF
jgi:FtsZ-binding cell division protein ZapB